MPNEILYQRLDGPGCQYYGVKLAEKIIEKLVRRVGARALVIDLVNIWNRHAVKMWREPRTLFKAREEQSQRLFIWAVL